MSGSELLVDVIRGWVADPSSAVEYAEEVEGRWAIRVRQEVRPYTTVWWTPGERSIRFEAYVLPLPSATPAAMLYQCLVRNRDTWRVRFAVDRREGAVLLVGRIPVECLTRDELELALGEVYETIEVAYPSLVRLFGERETSP